MTSLLHAVRVRVLPHARPWVLAPPKKPANRNHKSPASNDNDKPPATRGRSGKRHVHFCSICGETGHNRRSCPKRSGQ